jgi:hypothetical protein
VVVRVGDALLGDGFAEATLPVVDVENGNRGLLHGSQHQQRSPVPPGIDLIELSTGDEYLPAVRALLERRESRLVH